MVLGNSIQEVPSGKDPETNQRREEWVTEKDSKLCVWETHSQKSQISPAEGWVHEGHEEEELSSHHFHQSPHGAFDDVTIDLTVNTSKREGRRDQLVERTRQRGLQKVPRSEALKFNFSPSRPMN